MTHYLRLAAHSVRLQFLTWAQYRADYLAGCVGVLLEQATTLAILSIIFANIPSAQGWTFPQMLMIFGFARASLGIADAITENLWWVGNYAHDGTLVQYLCRPVGVLYQLIFERVYFDRLLHSVLGVGLIVYGAAEAGLAWSLGGVLLAVYLLALGALVYIGLMIISSALAILFVIDSPILLQSLWNLTEFAKYPTTLFSRPLLILFSSVLPIGFVGFYPAAVLLGVYDPLATALLATAVVGAFFGLSLLLWRSALVRYEAAGT